MNLSDRSGALQLGPPATYLPAFEEDRVLSAEAPDAATAPTAIAGGETVWHAISTKDTVAKADTNGKAGLTVDEANARLARHGPNALPERAESSLLMMFVGQFFDPLIYILFGAAILAAVLKEIHDAIVIFVVVSVNALIGTFQERRAERSMNALRKHSKVNVLAIRDGKKVVVEAKELVPGDVLVLAAGDAVGADARLIATASLETNEAALTGESLPVAKSTGPVEEGSDLGDRVNMVYAGTQVTAGSGRAIVVATGTQTELGKIATLAEESEQPPTPLEAKIAQFGKLVIWASLGMFAFVVVVGRFNPLFDEPLAWNQILLVAASQMVSVIPEGLPIAMTIALAVGMQRMASHRAIVRNLSAVETLGSTKVICSDKTGTLTKGELTATAVWLPKDVDLEVTGVGYEPDGEVRRDGQRVTATSTGDPDLRSLLEAAVLCNDAALAPPDQEPSAEEVKGGLVRSADDRRWRALGDPTEAALLTLARKAGIDPPSVRERQPRKGEIPFDAKTSMMATRNHGEDGQGRVFIKGALEKVLELCDTVRRDGKDVPLDDATRGRVEEVEQGLAGQALRVLAIAVVEADQEIGESREDDPMSQLIQSGVAPASQAVEGFRRLKGQASLLGLVGQYDPPRPEVKDAVVECRRAGIRPVMVTGDHVATANAIARELGISREGDIAITGRELESKSKEELAAELDRVSVFARVHPEQKHRIVEAYQTKGYVVAMTGDGVNDAPALAQADVGVAMGLTGTEVAKEASEIVVTDDNFATIVKAVEEGRVVYGNLQKVVLYLFATLVSEVLVLLLALCTGQRLPLVAVQILWVNLVTETPVTINLVMEPPEGDEMDREPVPRDEPLVSRGIRGRLALQLITMTSLAFGWFLYHEHWVGADRGLDEEASLALSQTATFTLIAVCCWFNALNCRSAHKSAFTLEIFRNWWLLGGLICGAILQAAVIYVPALNDLFHTVPLSLKDALLIGGVASVLLWVEEIRKLIVRLTRR